MTRAELIARLADRHPHLSLKDVDFAVRLMLDNISNALVRGQRIEFRDFGSFELRYRPPRNGRNPKTGGKVQIPAKHVPRFKPGKELRERVENKMNRTLRECLP
ncbi:MAG: integration host factor subunit beta [Gallionella sp.]|jgi:integration host factor subunit beta|nr:integration host factor subunit beta [Gallionella sp.]